MGYHIATFLAIHEFLISRVPGGPVPSFLAIDQPSQVYFPSDYFAKRGIEAEDDYAEDDLAATRRIFKALSEGLKRMNGGIQMIVTEHADESAWGGVEGVCEVENWRGPVDYLIPRAWLAQHDETSEN
jgi:hypothetical protein